MSYLNATNMHHGPPGPLDVLGDDVPPHAHSCKCKIGMGADDVRAASPLTGISVVSLVMGGLLYLMWKTRKKR